MQIRLNGESFEIAQGCDVAALVAQLQIDPRQAAIERNREIIPKSLYASTPLMEGDEVEIVGFIGGG